MADEDIGGIKIGITANLQQFREAMAEADTIIRGKAQQLRDRRVTMTVFAKVDNSTFGKIERDLNLVVKRAQENNAFQFHPEFSVAAAQIRTLRRNMAKASRDAGGVTVDVIPRFDPKAIEQNMAGQVIPVNVKGKWGGWAADKIPEDFVLIKGIWEDWEEGKGPKGKANGGAANGSAGGLSSKDADRIIKAIRDCCAMGGGDREPTGTTSDTGTTRREQSQAQQQRQADERRREETQRRWDERRERRRVEADNRARRAQEAAAPHPTATRKTAQATGEAVADKIKETPVKTEKAAKEKAEEKTAQRASTTTTAPASSASPAARPTPSAGGFLQCPSCNASVNPRFWDEHQRDQHGAAAAAPAAAAPAKATPKSTATANRAGRAVYATGVEEAKVSVADLRSAEASVEAYEKAANKGRQSGKKREELEARRIRVYKDLAEAQKDYDRAVGLVRAPKPEAAAAASTVAPEADLKAVEKQIDATIQAQEDAIDVVMSNVEASAMRMEEMPSAGPRPDVPEGSVRCPWCGDPFKKRGLVSHIRSKHPNESQGNTPGGYSREELARARATSETGGIGHVTPESTLLRNMANERREAGVYDIGPDVERLIGTVKRDKYGRAQFTEAGGKSRPIREGGLLRKGLDPTAMRQGLIQPLQDMPEEKQQALLKDPDFIALKDEFYEAIEVRRSQLKDMLAVELVKVAEDPERSETYLQDLQEAVADPASELGHQLGRQAARAKRREELGISGEGASGFSRRDLIASLVPEGGERPEGWEDLYNTYLQSELKASEADQAATAELDKALLKHRTGPEGSRKWDFGPDIQELRDLRNRAGTMPAGDDLEGWLTHAVGRGMPAETAEALRAEVEATPVGERGDLIANQIETLREGFGRPDPRMLEKIQRLAGGPRFGEDIEEFEEGDPRRTGLLARIRRSVIRGANNPEAARLRLQTVTDPLQRRTLKNIKPREMEMMEVAGIAAEAAAALDIIDRARNQAQSTEQAAATRESNIEQGKGAAALKPIKHPRRRGVAPSVLAKEEEELQERVRQRAKEAAAGGGEAVQEAEIELARARTAEYERKAEAQAAADAAAAAAAAAPIPEEKIVRATPAGKSGGRRNEPAIAPIDIEEKPISEMSLEEAREFKQADQYLEDVVEPRVNLYAGQPSSCPCGWKGLAAQYRFHLPGTQHREWAASGGGGATPPPPTAGGPKFQSEGFERGLPMAPIGARHATGGGPGGMSGGPYYCDRPGCSSSSTTERGLAQHKRMSHPGPAGVGAQPPPPGEPPAIAHLRQQAEAATAARIAAGERATQSFAGMPIRAGTAPAWVTEELEKMVSFAQTTGIAEEITRVAREGKLTAKQIVEKMGLHGGPNDPNERLLAGSTGPFDPSSLVRAVRSAAGIEPISQQISVGPQAAAENIAVEQAAEPAAQVAGQAATPPPQDKRWCSVCKRLISTRSGAWASHIGGRDHKANLQRVTGQMRAGFEDQGVPIPPGFDKTFQRKVEQSVELPPPELGMAGSNLEGLDEGSRKNLRTIAGTPGGRKSLEGAGFSQAEIAELLEAQGARAAGGAADAEDGDEEGGPRTPKRRPTLGRGGLATAIGPENFASIVRSQRKDWAGVQGLIQDQRQFAREVLEENPVRALSVAIGQVLVNLTGRADLKNTVGDIGQTATEVSALAKNAQDVSERFQAAWEGLAAPDLPEETVEALQRNVLELGGPEALKLSAEGGQVPTLGMKAPSGAVLGTGGVFGEIAEAFKEVAGVPLTRFQEVSAMQPKERRAAMKDLEREALAAEEAEGLGAQEQPQTFLAQAARLRQARLGIGIRTAATATVGIVGGTALFTAAMTAFNVAMEHGTEWVARVTAEMTGFAAQANVLAKALGQTALPTGRTEGAIRERLGMAGIGGEQAERLLGPIQERVQGEVQAERAIMMRDTAALAAQSMAQRQPGIQNFMGNFQPTGGVVLPLIGQTNIGAMASVQETLAGAVSGIAERTVPGGGGLLAGETRALVDIFTGGELTRQIDAAQKNEWATIVGGWTDAMQRGGSTAEFVSPELEGMQGAEGQLKQQAEALLANRGSPDLANRIRNGEIALVDEQGKLITSTKGVGQALDSLGEGLEAVDLEQLMRAGARQLEGTFYGLAENLRIQLTQQNPMQTALQLNAQPFMPFGAGVDIAATGMTGLLAGARSAGMRGEIEARAARGRSEMMNLAQARGGQVGVDPAQLESTFERIGKLGKDIVGWQTDIANMQLDQQMIQYNRQVFVAERNIADLQGLVYGVGDAHERNIGLMQKENLESSRRIQDIQRAGEADSLAMNQRQINFNLAVSKFATPGMSPGEAAAQVKQAKAEAEYAQRQQNRQVEIFDITGEMIPNERAIVDETNLRALEDALADFQIFQDNYTLDQKTKVVAENIRDAQLLQAGLTEDLNDMLGSLTQAQSVETQMTVDAFTRGEKNLRETAEVVKGVYAEVASDFRENWEIEFSATATKGSSGKKKDGSGGGAGGGSGAEKMASGGLFNTAGTTSLIAGEAGTETVAILRNPRQMRLGGGGGGGTFMLNINNPVVRTDADIEAIARQVQDVFSRQSRLFGL